MNNLKVWLKSLLVFSREKGGNNSNHKCMYQKILIMKFYLRIISDACFFVNKNIGRYKLLLRVLRNNDKRIDAASFKDVRKIIFVARHLIKIYSLQLTGFSQVFSLMDANANKEDFL